MSGTATATPTEERLFESAVIVEGSRNDARQTVDVDLIAEGFGNQRDNHYYSRELLEGNVAKFSDGADGVLMFSNHLTRQQEEELEGQPRPWQQIIGRILPGTSRIATREADGKTVVRGTALVSNPLAWAYIEADPTILKVSIDARGQSGPEQMIESEGRSGKPVLNFHVVKSVDVVSRAGAGGGNMKLNAMAEAWQAFTEAEAMDDTAAASTADGAADETADTADTTTDTAGADTTQEAGKRACPECKSDKVEGHKCSECGHEVAESSDTEAADATAAADAPTDAAVEEGAWEAVEDAEATEAGREATTQRNRAGSGFDLSQFRDEDIAGALGDTSEDRDTEPHERLPAGKGATPARRLAAQMEAEITRRVAEQREHDLAEAEASFQEALDRVDAEHARQVEQLHQRYLAREQIRAAEGLPDASREALIEQFHDFIAEPRREGDTVVLEARAVLRDAVARAIDTKRAEMREFASGPVVEAGASGAATQSEDKDGDGTPVRESASTPERPTVAPLDQQLDRELGIE